MAFGLLGQSLAGIDKQDAEIGLRRPRDHVARVLLVTWRIDHDELASRGCEIAVGDIDSDALFALCGQPVDQKRQVERCPLRSEPGAFCGQRFQLVGRHAVGFVKKAADQR